MVTQKARGLRVFLTALIPLLLAASLDWSSDIGVPIVAALAAAINVAYRRANPLDGTSQAWRFVRIFAFTAAPAAIGYVTDAVDGIALPIVAMVPALLEVAFRHFTEIYPEDAAK